MLVVAGSGPCVTAPAGSFLVVNCGGKCLWLKLSEMDTQHFFQANVTTDVQRLYPEIGQVIIFELIEPFPAE